MEQAYKNKEEYLDTLLEQIRCKKAHPFIEEEIRGHMEEQIDDNISSGMTREEAEKAAIADMGSPVEAGISLDRIHRPKMEWSMIILMAVISLVGIAIHYMVVNKMLISSYYSEGNAAITAGSANFAKYTIIGFIVMLVICHIDYTGIAKYARVIAYAFLVTMFLLSPAVFDGTINGNPVWIAGGGNIRVDLFSFLMLYVPLYGAVIYKYYGMGYRGFIKSVLWLIVPILLALTTIHIMRTGIFLIALGTVLSLAVWNNWFGLKNSSNRKILIGIWVSIIGLPVIGLKVVYAFGGLADYQINRIQAFLTNSGDADYMTNLCRDYLLNSQLVGNTGMEVIGQIPGFNSSCILIYLSSTYGIMAATLICCVLAALVIKVFYVSLKQKNQLGMVMGCGSGMVFFVNIVLNILENTGLFPSTWTFLPFFSAGGSNLVVCYALMGIILSIHRYKSIYPKHVNTKRKPLKIEIPL